MGSFMRGNYSQSLYSPRLGSRLRPFGIPSKHIAAELSSLSFILLSFLHSGTSGSHQVTKRWLLDTNGRYRSARRCSLTRSRPAGRGHFSHCSCYASLSTSLIKHALRGCTTYRKKKKKCRLQKPFSISRLTRQRTVRRKTKWGVGMWGLDKNLHVSKQLGSRCLSELQDPCSMQLARTLYASVQASTEYR